MMTTTSSPKLELPQRAVARRGEVTEQYIRELLGPPSSRRDRMTIAQRFIAGTCGVRRIRVPEGRMNSAPWSVVPTGLISWGTILNPAINRWAIVISSLQDDGRREASGAGCESQIARTLRCTARCPGREVLSAGVCDGWDEG